MSLGSQVTTICRVTPSGNPAAEGYEDQFPPLRPQRHCTHMLTRRAQHHAFLQRLMHRVVLEPMLEIGRRILCGVGDHVAADHLRASGLGAVRQPSPGRAPMGELRR
jgi:hypothetical protein